MTNRSTSEGPPSVKSLQDAVDAAPYHRLIPLLVEDVGVDGDGLRVRLRYHDTLQRADGTAQVHGGPIASIIDSAGTFAVMAAVGHGVPTVNLRVDYLRPAVGTDLIATTRVRRAGRTVAVADIDLHDDQERLVAVGRGTWGTAGAANPEVGG